MRNLFTISKSKAMENKTNREGKTIKNYYVN